jgi:hypothetical protein
MPSSVIAFLVVEAVTLGIGGLRGASGRDLLLGLATGGLSLVVRGIQQLRKKPDGAQAIVSNGTLSIRQAISPWQVIFGQRRVGGVLSFIFLTTDKKYLHIVATLAGHVSEEIGDIQLDDEVITPAMLDGSGVVSSGKFSRVDQTPHVETTTSTPYTSAFPVGAVTIVVMTFSDNPDNPQQAIFTDVSPAAPSGAQYSRSGNVFTFDASEIALGTVSITYLENVAQPVCRIKKSLGAEAGQPFPDLVSESEGKWVDTDRQTGHTKIYIRFDTSLLQGNAPNISAVVKGLKLYDPRTTLTAWSANPALAILTYLTNTEFGMGAALSETGSAEFIAAANSCEERVQLVGATTTFTADASTDAIALASGSRAPAIGDGVRVSSSGTLPAGLAAATTYYVFYAAGLMKLATSFANALAGTPVNITDAGTGTHTLTYFDEQRYTANGAFLTSERPVDVIQVLLSSMAGTLTQVSDTWRVFAGAYEAATLTLTASDFAGPIQIEPMQARDKWANGAKGVFCDPNSSWQPTDFPPQTPTATYLAEDGGETIYADMDYSAFVTSSGQSQRLARIAVRQARSGLVVTASFKLTAWRSFTGHSVALTFAKYGWSAKEFTIVQSGFSVIDGDGGPALGVQLTLRETFSSIFSWSAEDTTQPTPPRSSLPNPFAVAAPGTPTVTETLYSTSGSAGVKSRATVAWTAVVDPLIKSYEISWKAVTDADYTIVPVPIGTSLDIDDLAAGLYLFAVRSCTTITKSVWSAYAVKELLGLTAPPSDPTGFSLTATNGFAIARWTLSPDLDVRIGGHAIIRHSPLTTGAAWEDGILISGTVVDPGFPGDTITSPPLPLKTGTYLLKFQDSSGNYSVNEASFVVTEGTLFTLTTAVTITEDAAFSGAKTDVVVSGSSLQLASVNMALRSEDIASAPWSDINTPTVTSAFATFGSISLDKILDNDAASFEGRHQGFTVPSDGQSYTFSIHVLKTVGGTSPTFAINFTLSGGSAVSANPRLNTDTGVLSGSGGVQDLGAVWRLYGSVTNNTSGNTALGFDVYPASAAFGSFADVVTATGSAVCGGVQVEKGSSPSAYDKLVSTRVGNVVVATGSYLFNANPDDRGSVAARRFEATVQALSFDTGLTIDALLDLIDDWDSIDGSGGINDCNAQLMASVSDDNVTYQPYVPFHVADFKARYSKFRMDFTSGNQTHNIAVSQLRVAIKT